MTTGQILDHDYAERCAQSRASRNDRDEPTKAELLNCIQDMLAAFDAPLGFRNRARENVTALANDIILRSRKEK